MVVYAYDLHNVPFLQIEANGFIKGKITLQESFSVPINKLQYLIHYYANNQSREVSLLCELSDYRNASQYFWGFHIKDVIFFWWENKTNTINYKLEDNGTLELLNYWLLHVTLPIYLTVEDHYAFLHAGAVEIQSKPILFLAESFGGKSTMTDFFIQQGHAMISDDKVATYEEKGSFFSVPSHPYHRPYRKAEDMGKYVNNFANEPKPIHALYALEKVDKDENIEIDEIRGMEKFHLLRLSSQFNLSFQKTKRFEYLMRMSNSVPMYRIKIPWDINRLPEVYNTIIKHLK